MPKEDTIKIDGKIEELLPNMTFQGRAGKWHEGHGAPLW